MDEELLVIVCLVILAFLVGGAVGSCSESANTKAIREVAIEHGCASYVIVDEKTGRTEFKWSEIEHNQD